LNPVELAGLVRAGTLRQVRSWVRVDLHQKRAQVDQVPTVLLCGGPT